MSFDTLFTLIILLLLAVVFPLLGVRDYRLLLRRISAGVADARVKFYKGYIMWQWPLTIGLLAWWLLSGNGLESMGLIPVADGWPWVAIGIGVFGILAQVIYLATVSRNVDKLAAIKEQMGELSNLAPQTPREDRIGWSGSGMVHRVQWVVVHRNSTARDYRPDKRTSYGKSTADAAAANRLTRVFMSI